MEENETVFPLANIIGEIASKENVEEAFDYVVGHLECAEQREKYRPQKKEMCARLQKELASGTFRIKEFREMEVRDGPKVRKVQAPRGSAPHARGAGLLGVCELRNTLAD